MPSYRSGLADCMCDLLARARKNYIVFSQSFLNPPSHPPLLPLSIPIHCTAHAYTLSRFCYLKKNVCGVLSNFRAPRWTAPPGSGRPLRSLRRIQEETNDQSKMNRHPRRLQHLAAEGQDHAHAHAPDHRQRHDPATDAAAGVVPVPTGGLAPAPAPAPGQGHALDRRGLILQGRAAATRNTATEIIKWTVEVVAPVAVVGPIVVLTKANTRRQAARAAAAAVTRSLRGLHRVQQALQPSNHTTRSLLRASGPTTLLQGRLQGLAL